MIISLFIGFIIGFFSAVLFIIYALKKSNYVIAHKRETKKVK
jgi:ABC-type antimicrobial peptide transport system permease subunit